MNRLQFESSPYLLQHAHNPVDWYPWGDEALKRAKEEDKPILLSIGYAACHWCHVMERESFEDPRTAEFMNTHFVNIKVDREERPDLDNMYMNACQLLTGAGGWPLNVFLTPEMLPFSAGTYFPPKPGYGKPSWMEVLMYMHQVFTRERDKVEDQAARLAEHILKMDAAFVKPPIAITDEAVVTEAALRKAVNGIHQQFDPVDGGFGGAPKFPGSMTLRFLLRYAWITGDEQAMQHVHLSLQKMRQGGIYDHVGGGFARYAVDKHWMVPHFEKMLYDNALLASLYAEAFRATGVQIYADTCDEILQFAAREWLSPEGLFYAAYDADSEGVEGKFYTFGYDEFKQLAGDDADWAMEYFSITSAGNWEHTNILHTTVADAEFAEEKGWSTMQFSAMKKALTDRLYNYRANRIKPALDNKCILSWNALMCSAWAEAFKATQKEDYRAMAIRNMQGMQQYLRHPEGNGRMWHVYTPGAQGATGKITAFLEDYSAYMQSLLDLFDITGNIRYVDEAQLVRQFIRSHFSGHDGMYYFTGKDQADIPLRSAEFYDNATPSGNSMHLNNMMRLHALTGAQEFADEAHTMLANMRESFTQYGTSFGNWLMGALAAVFPYHEIVISGPEADAWRDGAFQVYLPHAVYAADAQGTSPLDICAGRFQQDTTRIFHCRDFTCSAPVSSVQDFIAAAHTL